MGDLGGAVLFSVPGLGTPSTVTLRTGLANGNLTLRTMVHPILNALYGGAGNLLSLGWEGLGLNEIFASLPGDGGQQFQAWPEFSGNWRRHNQTEHAAHS